MYVLLMLITIQLIDNNRISTLQKIEQRLVADHTTEHKKYGFSWPLINGFTLMPPPVGYEPMTSVNVLAIDHTR